MTIIETPRLALRRWRDADIAAMAAFNADPEVMRWIADGSVRDLDQTAAAIGRWERLWDSEGFGPFAVERRADGRLVGCAGLNRPTYLPELMPAVEIGWRFGRAFWGQGMATEAARAVLRFAAADLALDRVVSVHQVGNDASENIMRKLGMRRDRESVDSASGRTLRVYAITRAAVLAAGA